MSHLIACKQEIQVKDFDDAADRVVCGACACSAGLFDLLKKAYMRASGEDEAGVAPSIAFGVLSSFTGQLVAYPLETVTRHMQVQSMHRPCNQISHMMRPAEQV